jgi:HAE1 family hydrophobic/amphiphilic exporter-1
MMLLRFKLPVGTALAVTNEKMRKVEDFLQGKKEVSGVFSVVGGFGGDAVNQGMAFVTLVDRNKRSVSQAELIKEYRKTIHHMIPGMETVVQDLSLRGFASTRGFPVEFIIQGPDWDKLTELTSKMMDAMKKSGYVTDVNTDIQPGMPEVRITPDRQKMAVHAISLNTVTNALNSLVGGAILTGQTEYGKAGHRYEIELRLVANQREDIPDLNRIQLRNNRGETVPLSAVVTKEIKPSLMLISRLNRARAITVYANPLPPHSQQEALKATETLARSMLPPGYLLKMIGSSQSYRESFQSLIFALLLGIVVSYMVLASQFNSFIHPVTVLMALPFSFSGAFLGLWLFHQSINMYSLIGFILLMGIVKKNSILLVDFTNQVRRDMPDVDEALLNACPVRLRPILMTSVATVAGALPEALALGPGAETRIPMAIAIIGGVIASTILTLFVVPCTYSLMSKLERPDPLEGTA